MEKCFPENHDIMVSISIIKDKFDGGGSQDMKIDIFWGIKGLNTKDVDYWDPKSIGKAVMDDKFDLSPITAQQSLLKFCDDLRKQDFVRNKKVLCWVE